MNEDQARNFSQLAARWRELWEGMMTQYCPGRTSAFELALDVMEFTLRGAPLRILDVGCGSGAFAERALQRFPDAHITALDHDNETLRIARTIADEKQVRWVQAEVTQSWEALNLGEFDAVFMGWLTHELAPWQLGALYANACAALRPTGLLLNADFMPDLTPGFRELAQDMARRRLGDEFSEYQRQVSRDPIWQAAVGESDPSSPSVHSPPPSSSPAPNPKAETRWRVYHTATEHRRALHEAGFRESEAVWRYLDSGMILAVR